MQGILLMSLGFFCFALADMTSKLLTKSFHPLQVAWMRQFGLMAGIIVLLALHGVSVLKSRNPLLQLGRGLTVVFTTGCFVAALAYVPLADATAITFLTPFVVMILAFFILGERMNLFRWIAVTVGFAGTLLIVRPGPGMLHLAILLPVISSLAFAGRQVISKLLAGVDSLGTTVAYSGLTAITVLSLPLPFIWTTPETTQQLALMALMAAAAGTAEFAIIRALDMAEAIVLSPLQYTLMIWSTGWGVLIFSEWPDSWTLAGAALVVISGLATLLREGRRICPA